ncbi:lysophospholipid acyltransferase family protein [Sagittula sp. SSi028]|uniref:lysophospholipid acyltransferase family protein n=1 Tax=Sagittula sp. SSi028 TaxID=3400636 RepID=UPI003AF98A73
MSPTWQGAPLPPDPPIGFVGWLHVLRRGLPVAAVLIVGVLLSLLSRPLERLCFGASRPITGRITVAVCRAVLWLIGLRVQVSGKPLTGAGVNVSNHISWLDIFVLNSQQPLYFVSKSEVAGWPGIGLLAKVTGTVFIRRDRREAAAQTRLFQTRLLQNHRLLFFPEGTSTDGLRVLPFKTTLFAAFFDDSLRDRMQLQAISLGYEAPKGADSRFYGWWGDMDFASGLLRVLAQPRQGQTRMLFHPAVPVADFADRKALARHLETQVRAGKGPQASAVHRGDQAL